MKSLPSPPPGTTAGLPPHLAAMRYGGLHFGKIFKVFRRDIRERKDTKQGWNENCYFIFAKSEN
jgi:hypothetical protein